MDPKCFMVCDSDDEPYDGSEAGEGAHSKEWVDQLQKNARVRGHLFVWVGGPLKGKI